MRLTNNLKPRLELKYKPESFEETKIYIDKNGKKEEQSLKISGTLNEVLKVAVSGNPKPQKGSKKI